MKRALVLVLVVACDRGPRVAIDLPDDIRGAASVQVTLRVHARGHVVLALAVDGAPLVTLPVTACDGACSIPWTWDTHALASGPHRLEARARDDSGRDGDSSREIVAGDVVYVRQIEVTHERDWPTPRLEIEAHLFDADDGTPLGCAGAHDGLAGVDRNDRLYTVTGVLRDHDGAPLDPAALAAHNLRLDVIEDDVHPCPAPPEPPDDEMGSFGPATLDQLTAGPMHAGKVVQLDLVVGRPWML